MSARLLVDTGALLCLLAEGSEHHAWAVKAMRGFAGPALTTEPVLTETAYLLRRFGQSSRAVLEALVGRKYFINIPPTAVRPSRFAGSPTGSTALYDPATNAKLVTWFSSSPTGNCSIET